MSIPREIESAIYDLAARASDPYSRVEDSEECVACNAAHDRLVKFIEQAIADAIDQREAETIKRCARACATFQVDYGTHICGDLFAKHVRSLLRKQKP